MVFPVRWVVSIFLAVGSAAPSYAQQTEVDASLTCVGIHAEWRRLGPGWSLAEVRAFERRVPGECTILASRVAGRIRQLQPAPPTVPRPPSAVARPAYPTQTTAPRSGVALVLENLSEMPNPYIGPVYAATIRIENSGPSDIGVTVEISGQHSAARAYLTDSSGGSCQMIQNGDSWGTLGSVYNPLGNEDRLVLVPSNGSIRRTIRFNSIRCETRLRDRDNLDINGVLNVVRDGELIRVPFNFTSVPMYRQ